MEIVKSSYNLTYDSNIIKISVTSDKSMLNELINIFGENFSISCIDDEIKNGNIEFIDIYENLSLRDDVHSMFYFDWKRTLKSAEIKYNNMLEDGIEEHIARGILPGTLKLTFKISGKISYLNEITANKINTKDLRVKQIVSQIFRDVNKRGKLAN